MVGVEEHKLCKELRPVVEYIARKYERSNRRCSIDDLRQQGYEGAIRAIRKWRPDGGANLATYATYWIDQYIKRFALEVDGVVRLPNRKRAQRCEYLGVSIDAAPTQGAGRQGDLAPVFPELTQPARYDDQLAEHERAEVVREVLATLPERDRSILEMALDGQPYRDIGPRFDLGPSRVAQVVQKWMPILRKRLEKELSHDDL